MNKGRKDGQRPFCGRIPENERVRAYAPANPELTTTVYVKPPVMMAHAGR